MRDPTRVYAQPADATGKPLPGSDMSMVPRFRATERKLRFIAKQAALDVHGADYAEPYDLFAVGWIEGLAAGIAEGLSSAETEARMDAAIRRGFYEGTRRRQKGRGQADGRADQSLG